MRQRVHGCALALFACLNVMRGINPSSLLVYYDIANKGKKGQKGGKGQKGHKVPKGHKDDKGGKGPKGDAPTPVLHGGKGTPKGGKK